jgi:hypothetical protein
VHIKKVKDTYNDQERIINKVADYITKDSRSELQKDNKPNDNTLLNDDLPF